MSTSQAPDRLDRRAWSVLLVLCGAIFLEGIDVGMLNVALPSIRADLGLSTATLSGVVSAYVLGYGGFMLLGGRAADLFGRRRMFLTWLVVFVLFSGLGGLASEGWMLLVARFVTGVAAAFMTPAGLSIITTTFSEGPRRNKALLVYAGTAAGGFSSGLVIGGLLTAIDWRWVFFAPVILALVVLFTAIPLIKDDNQRSAERMDLGGAVAVTGSMMLLVYGVVRLEHPGQGWGWTVAVFAAGIALLVAFVRIEQRSAAPLLRLGLLRSGPLLRANIGAGMLTGSFGGFQFIVTMYLQEVRGWSTLETGLALLVVAIDTFLAPTLTPRLVERFGNVRVILGGFLFAAVAYAVFLPISSDWTYWAMLPAMILLGLGFSLAYGPLTIAATDGVAEHEQGVAGSVLNTSFQFGSALGISTVTAIGVANLHAALLVPLVAAVIAVVVTTFGVRRRAGVPEPANALV